MNKLIIQLLGQARSGKDWTASQLKAYFESQGKSVEVMSYAAPMKRITATLFNISLEQLDDFKNNSDKVDIEVVDYRGYAEMHLDRLVVDTNFRELLQRLGNQAMKPEFGDDVWVKLMQANIDKSSADIIIIPDCRFNIELEAVGGITVRVVNNSLPPPMNHASELELLHYATMYSIDNTNYSVTSDDIANLAKRILSDN